MAKFTSDPAAVSVAPSGVAADTTVTFRGWLSAKGDDDPLDGGVYRIFISPWFDEWIDVQASDLLHQDKRGDGSSFLWVKREAKVVRCHQAEACQFAEEEAEIGQDPTTASSLTAKYPRYP